LGEALSRSCRVPPAGRRPDGGCEDPPTIDNGMHNGTKGAGFVHGSVVAYKCKDGFTLAGAAFLQCTVGDQSRGVWSKPAPECRGELSCVCPAASSLSSKYLFFPS
ncbi:C4BPA protein, partial [Alca torda]|nr:C4BPA protein [Alca torda]